MLAGALLVPGAGPAGAGSGKKAALKELTRWAEGPVRWLLLTEEWKEMKQVSTSAEGLGFIERFWARRDANAGEPGNAFRETFAQRVEAADLLYPEGGLRGSLTDRGRALILLGPPSHVQLGTRPRLAWDARRNSGRRVTTENMQVEVWGYRLSDLPRMLFQTSRDLDRKPSEALTLTLTFVSEPKTTYLSDGENLLELAARAAVYVSED